MEILIGWPIVNSSGIKFRAQSPWDLNIWGRWHSWLSARWENGDSENHMVWQNQQQDSIQHPTSKAPLPTCVWALRGVVILENRNFPSVSPTASPMLQCYHWMANPRHNKGRDEEGAQEMKKHKTCYFCPYETLIGEETPAWLPVLHSKLWIILIEDVDDLAHTSTGQRHLCLKLHGFAGNTVSKSCKRDSEDEQAIVTQIFCL